MIRLIMRKKERARVMDEVKALDPAKLSLRCEPGSWRGLARIMGIFPITP